MPLHKDMDISTPKVEVEIPRETFKGLHAHQFADNSEDRNFEGVQRHHEDVEELALHEIDGVPGAGEDQASFLERREAEAIAAKLLESSKDSTPAPNMDSNPETNERPAVQPGISGFMSSLLDSAKRKLNIRRNPEHELIRMLEARNPEDLSQAERRTLLRAQLSRGEQDKSKINRMVYRRPS
jgi:hypothetical protein